MSDLLIVQRYPRPVDDTVGPVMMFILPASEAGARDTIGQAARECQADGITRIVLYPNMKPASVVTPAMQSDGRVAVCWLCMSPTMYGFRRGA